MAREIDPQRWRTVQVIPMTAFNDRDELDLGPMKTLFARLYEAGVRVFVPCAGSAEFQNLSREEIVSVVRMTRQTVGDDALILAPIGQQIHWAIELGQASLEAGADGLLVMPVVHPYLSNAGVRDYYLRLLETLDAPQFIYKKGDIPSDALLLELAEHPRMIGVKYAVNDVDVFRRTVQADGGRIDWYCGSAERYAPFFTLAGAAGYTSGAANVCPKLTLGMHAAMKAGNWTEALRLLDILRPIEDYRGRDGGSYNITLLKYALKHVGLEFGPPRPPARRLTATETPEIDALLGPILRAEAEYTLP